MPLLALLVVQLNFGLLPAAQKVILRTLSPWALFGIRTTAAAVFFLLIYGLWRKLRKPSLVQAESVIHPKIFLWLSFLGISANQFLLLTGLTMTSSVAAVIVIPSITLFTFLFALLLKRESFSWQKMFILLLGGMGVFILFADSFLQFMHGLHKDSFIGNLFCLTSTVAFALYLVLSRDLVGKMPALQFSSRIFAYSLLWTLVFLILGFLCFPSEHFWLQSSDIVVPPSTWWALLFVILGPTVLNYFLNLWALQSLSASTVSGFISLQTLVGAIVSHYWLGEEISPSYGLAAFCILLSIVLLSWQSFKAKA